MEFIRIHDCHISYVRYGEPQPGSMPVLLLHGAYLSHETWMPQVSALAGTGRLAIAPDLRGHGLSGKEGQPYSVKQYARDMLELLPALGASPAFVCGHSLGGMVAQQMAIDDPAAVGGLLLAETSYGIRSSWLEALLSKMAKALIQRSSIAWQASLYARQLGSHSPATASYVEQSIGMHVEDPASYRSIWEAVNSFNSFPYLKEIRCPTLVLVGEHNHRTHAQARRLAHAIPGAQMKIIPEAGHLLNWDNPAGFNEALLSFCG